MFRKARKLMLVIFMIISIFITSCSTEEAVKKQSPVPAAEQGTKQIVEDLQYLCSDECQGRAIGTPGNIKAGDYISTRFKEIGLEPLDNSYQIPYKKQTGSINKTTLELLDAGNPIYTFNYGKDYLEISLGDAMLTLPICSEPANTDCVVITDDAKKIVEYEKNSHTRMLVLKDQGVYGRSLSFYVDGGIPKIRASKEAFKILQDNMGKTLRFSTDIDIQEMEHKNIVGVIKGENSGSALVVSAHFDHIGSAGTPGSPNYIILPGALDNASGVSTMLETGRYLKNIYEGKKPPFDIIFCAFNGEEQLHTKGGSNYFMEYIKGKYSSVFDINLDCLGGNGSTSLFMAVNDTTESKAASQKIIDNLKSQNTNVELMTGGYSSDHMSFKHAVCINTLPDPNKSVIHTTEDTPDKINAAFLSETANMLANCIRDNIGTIGIDKMNLSETAQISNSEKEATEKRKTLLTPSEFENNFNCKLDFLDDKQAKILIFSRIGDYDGITKVEPAPAKDFPDIRNIHFLMKPCTITFTPYRTKDKFEMDIYNLEMEANRFVKGSEEQEMTIGKSTYYVFNQGENGGKFLVTEFKDEDIILRVSISSAEFDKFNLPEQYKDLFEKDNLGKLINDMVNLFQDRV